MKSHDLAAKLLALPNHTVLFEGDGCYHYYPTGEVEPNTNAETGEDIIFISTCETDANVGPPEGDDE